MACYLHFRSVDMGRGSGQWGSRGHASMASVCMTGRDAAGGKRGDRRRDGGAGTAGLGRGGASSLDDD